jgi:hypothetical protein
LRQGKARRHGKPAPLIEIPCTAALRRMLDGIEHSRHEDRTVVQEALLRSALGSGDDEGRLTVGHTAQLG